MAGLTGLKRIIPAIHAVGLFGMIWFSTHLRWILPLTTYQRLG
jgi:hypothetical protein